MPTHSCTYFGRTDACCFRVSVHAALLDVLPRAALPGDVRGKAMPAAKPPHHHLQRECELSAQNVSFLSFVCPNTSLSVAFKENVSCIPSASLCPRPLSFLLAFFLLATQTRSVSLSASRSVSPSVSRSVSWSVVRSVSRSVPEWFTERGHRVLAHQRETPICYEPQILVVTHTTLEQH